MNIPPSLSLSSDEIRAVDLPIERPRENATSGEPVERFRQLFAEKGTVVGVWESTVGRYPAHKHGRHSAMYILSGRATVIDTNGQSHELVPGSVLIEPDGWTGEWDVHETLRKFYVISPAAPESLSDAS
jgi:hypothetical protein